jgi:hypothetical protein
MRRFSQQSVFTSRHLKLHATVLALQICCSMSIASASPLQLALAKNQLKIFPAFEVRGKSLTLNQIALKMVLYRFTLNAVLV